MPTDKKSLQPRPPDENPALPDPDSSVPDSLDIDPDSLDINDSDMELDQLRGQTKLHAKPPRLEDEGQPGG